MLHQERKTTRTVALKSLLGEWRSGPSQKLRLVPKGPGFEPNLFHDTCYMPSSLVLNKAKSVFVEVPAPRGDGGRCKERQLPGA
jgi:hypothetical protein